MTPGMSVITHAIAQGTFSAVQAYRVFTRSSKRPALHLLEVCWTFAGSCNTPLGCCCVYYNRDVYINTEQKSCFIFAHVLKS